MLRREPCLATFKAALVTAALAATPHALAQASAPAQATPSQIAAPDVLQLTDGTTLQGRVLEVRLFQDATILLADGTIRTVQWSTIANASADIWNLQAAANWRASAVVLPPVPIAPVPGPYDLLQPGPGRVPLRVESDGEAQNVGVGSMYRRREPLGIVCTTPCTLYVYPGVFPLYTGGPNARPAVHPVHVTSQGARVIAHSGSPTTRGLGAALLSIGAVGLVAGGVIALGSSYGGGGTQSIGWVMTLASVASMAGGIAMIRSARPGLTYVGPAGTGLALEARF